MVTDLSFGKSPKSLNKPKAGTCSKETLLRMAEAAAKAVECMRLLNDRGSNLVLEVLRGPRDFVEWQHYPDNGIYDPKSHAQYYFHAHPREDRENPDYGHFHTFFRHEERQGRISDPKSAAPRSRSVIPVTHLTAISMTPDGMPVRLFTTNRWVTAETWYSAAEVIRMLDEFVVDLNEPSPELNKWLTAMFVLFRTQIEQLLIERDDVLVQWRAKYPEGDPFEDRNLGIMSSLDISLFEQIDWIDRAIEAFG